MIPRLSCFGVIGGFRVMRVSSAVCDLPPPPSSSSSSSLVVRSIPPSTPERSCEQRAESREQRAESREQRERERESNNTRTYLPMFIMVCKAMTRIRATAAVNTKKPTVVHWLSLRISVSTVIFSRQQSVATHALTRRWIQKNLSTLAATTMTAAAATTQRNVQEQWRSTTPPTARRGQRASK
jgi:predicted ATP-dependent protease